MVSKVVVMLAVAVAGLAYYLYTPLPPDLDQKAVFRIGIILGRVERLLNWIGPLFLGHTNTYQFTRAFYSTISKALSPDLNSDPDLQITEKVFDGVPVRVYRPKGAVAPSPVLMYFHGGGWSIGSVQGEDASCRHIAKNTNIVVISVEYRLAPEHPFPAALDDCVKATRHVMIHAQQLGLDNAKVGVTGISAGGNLAAAVSLAMGDVSDPDNQSVPPLRYHIPLAPAMQGLDFSLPSYLDNDPWTGGVIWSRADVPKYCLSYAGLDLSSSTVQQVLQGQHIRASTREKLKQYVHRDLLVSHKEHQSKASDDSPKRPVNETLAKLAEPVVLNPLFSPLLAPDDLLKHVPRALVVTSHYDVLRDEGTLYVRRLRQVGVAAREHVVGQGQHISMMLQPLFTLQSPQALQAWREVFDFIKDSNAS